MSEVETEKEVSAEEIKKEVDLCIKECREIIIKRMNNLKINDNGANWLFIERVTNFLWIWSHPHAPELAFKNMFGDQK